ncbi:mitogen-activated protein kinase kinase kinase kinase 2 isoform X4 [Scomber scombrus]|uniref:Mitogen-activated protein kinase kinase kinase kinase 2 isoform X4 n=1 Tax=Scomber scombrus TaxID=13677 RepID=A0AAV1PAI8_SCOSC
MVRKQVIVHVFSNKPKINFIFHRRREKSTICDDMDDVMFLALTLTREEKDLTLRPSCTLGPDAAIAADSTSNTAGLARCSATQDIRQRCSDPCLPVGDAVTAEKRKVTTVSSPKRETPLSPEWSTLRKKTEDAVSSSYQLVCVIR